MAKVVCAILLLCTCFMLDGATAMPALTARYIALVVSEVAFRLELRFRLALANLDLGTCLGPLHGT